MPQFSDVMCLYIRAKISTNLYDKTFVIKIIKNRRAVFTVILFDEKIFILMYIQFKENNE